MEPTPTEAAIAEQQQREAAFTRAQANLSAIRSGKAGGWRNTPIAAKHLIYRRGLSLVASAILFLGVYALARLHGWDLTEWDSSREVMAQIAFALLGTLVLVHAVGLEIRRRRQHPAERLLHDFYEEAGKDGVPVNLERFVIEADALRADRRTPDVDTGTAVLRAPGIADNLNRYWHNLLRPAARRRHEVNVKSVRIHELAPDLVFASVTLVVTKAMPLWCQVLIGIFGVVAIAFLPVDGMSLALFAVGCAIGLTAIALWHRRSANRGRTHTVRKLVVKSNNQWRMFCGDWEGWEERHLSWLDDSTTPPQTE